MEMNGGSIVSYLACTPCVPLFLLNLKGLEAQGFLNFQGRRGITSAVRWNPHPVIFGVESRKGFHSAEKSILWWHVGLEFAFWRSLMSCPVYIYMCCEVIIWSKFGVFGSYYLVQVGVFGSYRYYLVQVCFIAYKNSGFKRFLHTQLSFCVSFLCPIIWQFSKIAFFKKRVQKLGFSIFSVLSLNFENSLF